MSWEDKTWLQIESESMEALQQARANYEKLKREHSGMSQDARDIGLDTRDGNLML